MTLRVILLGVVSLAACSEQKPENPKADAAQTAADADYQKMLRLQAAMDAPVHLSNELLDRIEAQLAGDACVGPMDRWERRYTLGLDHDRGGLDNDTIWFKLHEAGKYEFRSGRRVVSPGDSAGADDRPYRFGYGTYDIPSGTLTVLICGPNVKER